MSSSLGSSILCTSPKLPGPSGPLCKCSTTAPPLPSNLLSSFCPLSIFSLCTLTTASYFKLLFYTSCFLFPPDSLRVLQWNAGDLCARSTKLLHFIPCYDLISIQESNLNSSFSFRIPGFSALKSDRNHSRSSIYSPDTMHVSGSVIIFVRQGLSFSELSTSTLSSLDPYSGYLEVNISLDSSSSLLFLNVNTSPISSSSTNRKTDSFSLSILPPNIYSFWRTSTAITPL